MRYSEELIEEVRARNDIVDVISGYVSLKKKGGNHWGLCPFHNEKTASFSVSGPKQMYYCFGCGAGGNVFTFLMNYENMSFQEAVKALADRAGISLPEQEEGPEAAQRESKRARILEINREAAKFYYFQLRDPRGAVGYRYLQKRELTDETMHRFGLGYAGKSGEELIRYLRGKGFEDELIKEAGLAVFTEKQGLVSQFWNRVMFPIQDLNNRVIGFGGRVMGDALPKYLNSPETLVFDKRRNLYGLNFARKSRAGNIILCEGYMDVIAMHQAGFTQAVASLGTAFTAEQAVLLKRYTDNVLLAYDSDGAGVKAALRAIGILRETGLTGKVIDMKPYKDPDEFMKALGSQAFQERIQQAENSFFFEIGVLARQFRMDDPEEKTKFHREIAKKLCEFSEDVERENYLQAVADRYLIGVGNLRKLVNSYITQTGLAKPAERPKSGIHSKTDPGENEKKPQRLLVTWLSDQPALYEKIKAYISPQDFTDELYRKVADRLFSQLEEGQFQPGGIISMFEDEQEQREVAALFNTSLPTLETAKEREKAFRDILLAVKKNSYEHYTEQMGGGVNDLKQAIESRKALEELAKTHISLD